MRRSKIKDIAKILVEVEAIKQDAINQLKTIQELQDALLTYNSSLSDTGQTFSCKPTRKTTKNKIVS
jgi:hypothetical protein